VLLGNGDGTFQSGVSTPSGANLTVVAATDLNGDGKIDVVGVFHGMLMVYLGKGNGTFQPGVAYNLNATPVSGTEVTFGDVNGDHKIDVIVSIGATNGQEIVFLGRTRQPRGHRICRVEHQPSAHRGQVASLLHRKSHHCIHARFHIRAVWPSHADRLAAFLDADRSWKRARRRQPV
jgi:FG-GAP-like repeat